MERSKYVLEKGYVLTQAFDKYKLTGSTYTTNATRAHFELTSKGLNPGNFRNPTNWSYSYKRTRRNYYSIVSLDAKGSGTRITGNKNSGDVVYPTLLSSNLAYEQALEKLGSKVRGDMDLSINAFQVKQNARMMNVLGRLHNFSLTKLGKFGSLLQTVGSGYLEWQYGIKPIIQDIYGIADESLRFHINSYSRIRARRSEKTSDRTYLKNINGFGGTEVVTNRVAKVEISINMATPNGFDIARWTSLNPLSIAYELIPYSFVLDWFYNVGGFLRGVETGYLYGSRFLGGYVSRLSHSQMTRVQHAGTTAPGIHLTDSNQSSEVCSFSRTVLYSYPLPHAPVLRCRLGSGQLLNAAAMLGQFLKR